MTLSGGGGMWCEPFVLPRSGKFPHPPSAHPPSSSLLCPQESNLAATGQTVGGIAQLWAARAGGWADGWRGAGGGGGGREFSGFPGAHPGAQIRASRRASAPTRRAARARGWGGLDRRLVQLSNDGLGTPPSSFLASVWRKRWRWGSIKKRVANSAFWSWGHVQNHRFRKFP
eukprot:gene19471-biopygen10037